MSINILPTFNIIKPPPFGPDIALDPNRKEATSPLSDHPGLTPGMTLRGGLLAQLSEPGDQMDLLKKSRKRKRWSGL